MLYIDGKELLQLRHLTEEIFSQVSSGHAL